MITSIAELEKGWRTDAIDSNIAALVASTKAKYAIVIKIKMLGKDVQYLGAVLEENKGAEIYLYGDSPHWPGLFITGRIPGIDIQKIKRIIGSKEEKDESKKDTKSKDKSKYQKGKQSSRKRKSDPVKDLKDLLNKKIGWISDSTILNDEELIERLPENQRYILLSLQGRFSSIKELIKDKQSIDEINNIPIVKDVLRIIKDFDPKEGESGDLLLTFKFLEDSKEYYVGEVKEYRNIFKKAITSLRNPKKKQRDRVICTVCNNQAPSDTFKHPPLPFFTLDKPNFIPNGNPDFGFKVFPLCQECYMKLRRGRAYIEENLDYSIPNPYHRGATLKFWLIPVLSDPTSVQTYLYNLNRGGLYLKNLKTMCEKMELITQIDSHLVTQADPSESFLSFTALFYMMDTQGHMRLISSEQGIYPKRLRYIVEVKAKVDALYPFRKEGIRFGFPLLREFIETPKKEGWYPRLSSLLSSIFVGNKADEEFIFRVLIQKIRDSISKKFEPEDFNTIVLKALSVIDYLVYLQIMGLPSEEVGAMNAEIKDRAADEALRFLDSHSKFLASGTLRAVCATGISVGILLEIQRSRPDRSMPFWSHLNRLELDLNRLRALFPQVLTKLQQYDEHRFDQLLHYLGADEISKLDISMENLNRDLVSLVFAVGLSEGHRIYMSI
jgi:CRISPR-associated protein Csh1